MSRVSVLEQIMGSNKLSALDFNYDELWAPPIMSLFTPADIDELIRIATSIRYNANIKKKYELIDAVMRNRGFRKAHCGTNRVVYNFLGSSKFIAKVAIDRVGMTDSPAEYKNQKYFEPFCCKIFEVHPSGVIAFIERVNPISSIEEFISVKDDVFNLMVTKIIGKYVVDDLGTKAFMNFGLRMNADGHTFGPVIIDFPYVFELDGGKLKCKAPVTNKLTGISEVCNGDIDYDAGFNNLVCTKCGRPYKAMDLAKNKSEIELVFDNNSDKAFAKKISHMIRARIIDNGKVIYDSGKTTKKLLSKEEYEMTNRVRLPLGDVVVGSVVKEKYPDRIRKVRNQQYTALQKQYYANKLKEEREAERAATKMTVEVTSEPVDETMHTVESVSNSNGIHGSYVEAIMVSDAGSSIPKYDAYINNIIKTAEAATFPEMSAVVSTDEATIVMNGSVEGEPDTDSEPVMESEDKVGSSEMDTVVYEDSIPSTVFSAEEVDAMVKENTPAGSSAVEAESSILNPEADANPLNNPIMRPYSDPTVSVLYKAPKGNNNPMDIATSNTTTSEDDDTDDQQEPDDSEDDYDDTYDDMYEDNSKYRRNKKFRNNM